MRLKTFSTPIFFLVRVQVGGTIAASTFSEADKPTFFPEDLGNHSIILIIFNG